MASDVMQEKALCVGCIPFCGVDKKQNVCLLKDSNCEIQKFDEFLGFYLHIARHLKNLLHARICDAPNYYVEGRYQFASWVTTYLSNRTGRKNSGGQEVCFLMLL